MRNNFQHGLYSMGVPVFGYGIPPITGTYYHVLPGSTAIIGTEGKQIAGSSGNSGLTVEDPLDSIETAYAKCVSGAGDGIILWSYGTSTAMCTSYLNAPITWSKWGITVVGVCAPTMFAQRARISTSEVDLANLITVSGSNNTFLNFSAYNSGTTGPGCIEVTGNRNYFGNVNIVGGNGMTVPTITDYSLKLNGGSENTFDNCVIGTDTFDKSDIAGGELIVDNGCMRNRFRNCEFVSYRTAGTTAAMIVLVGSDAITRTMLFDNCFFQMYRDGNVTAEASVVIGDVPNNGFIIFKDCVRHGFTDWGAVAATGRVYSASKANAEAAGITIAANPS